ncbi:hypothetical protein [Paenibacillus tianjinensis]|uniref:Uncharacterized protein n=1 Tax=Paenibacillus tianjinensis TaxID=2810347 RepID=A0ABX7LBJ0_9BACL|nr:hypothetical protein [Paenibacillus tianjinensis]QSF43825.1 hypothetical protein JRJ22_21615 [Paenibacillus tianjinensis]
MLKKVWNGNPRWFTLIWSFIMLTYILLMVFRRNDEIMTGLLFVLFVAVGVRDWNKLRRLAVFSFILAGVFLIIDLKTMLG